MFSFYSKSPWIFLHWDNTIKFGRTVSNCMPYLPRFSLLFMVNVGRYMPYLFPMGVSIDASIYEIQQVLPTTYYCCCCFYFYFYFYFYFFYYYYYSSSYSYSYSYSCSCSCSCSCCCCCCYLLQWFKDIYAYYLQEFPCFHFVCVNL